MSIKGTLNSLAEQGMNGFTLWRTKDGRWQANARLDDYGDGWLCETAPTMQEAIEALRNPNRKALCDAPRPKPTTEPTEKPKTSVEDLI